MFVLAAHTFCSCVKATCRGGEQGREGERMLGLFAPPPVLVSPVGLAVVPTAPWPLCPLYVYDGEMPADEDADSRPAIPQVAVLFDKDDSWLTSLCPSARAEETHAFHPPPRNNLPPK